MSWVVRISYPAEFARFIIPVGSIAVDGVSLTVASLEGSEFTISVIPHTLEKTTLSDVQSGMAVNLEFDLVGKYIERLLTHGEKEGSGGKGGITLEKLAGWGFGA
jgi:riboflavin synthase